MKEQTETVAADRFAQNSVFSELPGVAFAFLTLAYIVLSFVSLQSTYRKPRTGRNRFEANQIDFDRLPGALLKNLFDRCARRATNRTTRKWGTASHRKIDLKSRAVRPIARSARAEASESQWVYHRRP